MVSGDVLEQGDLLEPCPVFLPTDELPDDGSSGPAVFERAYCDVVVMSQSCDMDREHPKIDRALVCPVHSPSEFPGGSFDANDRKENVRKGRYPAFHMIGACDLFGFEREARIVDFRQVFSLSLALLRTETVKAGRRLRLMPPYREHLAQAFARFFMRIGLPADIPPFV